MMSPTPEYPRHRCEWRVLTISEESEINLTIRKQNHEMRSPLT